MRRIVLLAISLMIVSGVKLVYADVEDVTELAKKAQNPVAKMISLPFNSNWNMNLGPQDRTQYILDIKPVIPFSIDECWNLITRTIIPVVSQPNLVTNHGSVNGVGDINPTFFLSPNTDSVIRWGIGPSIILPTATNDQLGQGQYSAGPSFVILATPGPWVIGVLTTNVWSVTGESGRAPVNQFSLQYFINYNFKAGWYVTSSPIITADWYATSRNRWTVPFGLGLGRIIRVGKQPINISLQAYDNVKSPTIGPDWQAQFNISFLFPV